MKPSHILLPAALSLLVAACGAPETKSQTIDVSADETNLRAHLEFLADDDLKGRQTGSEGHEIASNYIVSEFKKLGLEPAGDDGSFYQRIPFRKSTLK